MNPNFQFRNYIWFHHKWKQHNEIYWSIQKTTKPHETNKWINEICIMFNDSVEELLFGEESPSTWILVWVCLVWSVLMEWAIRTWGQWHPRAQGALSYPGWLQPRNGARTDSCGTVLNNVNVRKHEEKETVAQPVDSSSIIQ